VCVRTRARSCTAKANDLDVEKANEDAFANLFKNYNERYKQSVKEKVIPATRRHAASQYLTSRIS
jgi:hypothetical protein